METTIHLSPLVFIIGCLGATLAVLANLISFTMIGKINERVPESERISYLWWGTEVRKKFKGLYPQNRLVFLLDSCVVLLFLSFLCLIRLWVFK